MILTFIGSTTAFVAASSGLVQNDLKRIVAFSTISQLGYASILIFFLIIFITLINLSSSYNYLFIFFFISFPLLIFLYFYFNYIYKSYILYSALFFDFFLRLLNLDTNFLRLIKRSSNFHYNSKLTTFNTKLFNKGLLSFHDREIFLPYNNKNIRSYSTEISSLNP